MKRSCRGEKQAKTIATLKLNDYQINQILKAADIKSKVMDYVWNKTREPISKKPTYINTMTRRECTNIFAVNIQNAQSEKKLQE